MTTVDKNPERLLPGVIAWFAVWRWCRHWSPWKRWTVTGVGLLIVYILSPIIIIPVVDRAPVAWRIQEAAYLAYVPLQLLDYSCPPVHLFYEQSFRLSNAVLDRWLGPVPGTVNAPLPPTPPPPPLPADFVVE